MPRTKVVFIRDADGSVPVKKWLDELFESDPERYTYEQEEESE